MSPIEKSQLKIPIIDFRGLNLHSLDDAKWNSVRCQVLDALQSIGCFEAIYDGVSPEVKEEFFTKAAPELFDLPLETKLKNVDPLSFDGYIGQIEGLDYESLKVHGAPKLECVEEFGRTMWPNDGNPTFCKTVWSYAKGVHDLDQMIQKMILESLGVDNYFASHVESQHYALRLSYYGIPLNKETKVVLPEHIDPQFISIIGQYNVNGLEVQTQDGDWIQAEPKYNSFSVMTGYAYRMWSNDWIKGCNHRVRISTDEKRYSSVYSCVPKFETLMQSPKELIDKEHPLKFKPWHYQDFVKFRFSTEGRNAKDPPKAFCGVDEDVEGVGA